MKLRSIALVLMLFLGIPALEAEMGTEARADTAYRIEARMPRAAHSTALAWTGKYVYGFGGWDGTTNGAPRSIFRFDPSTGSVETLATRLPIPVSGAAAVWDGEAIYLMGGRHLDWNRRVFKFDPVTEVVTPLAVEFPYWEHRQTALIASGSIYVFGGEHAQGHQIFRFDPSVPAFYKMNSEILGASIPGASGFSDGRYIYIASVKGPAPYGRVDRFDPQTDTITRLSAKFSNPHTSAVAWDGSRAYFFGGADYPNWSGGYPPEYLDTISSFDPHSDSAIEMNAKLPTMRAASDAISTPYGIFVFGGHGYYDTLDRLPGRIFAPASFLDEIVRYEPVPGPPQSLRLSALSPQASPTLVWEPPMRNTFSGELLFYRIHRKTNPAEEWSIIASVQASTLLYEDNECVWASLCIYSISAVNASGPGELSEQVIYPLEAGGGR